MKPHSTMKHLWIKIFTLLVIFPGCDRNKEKEPITENSLRQDSTHTVSSQYPPIIYDSDSFPIFYLGQDVYKDVEEAPTFKGGHYQDFGNYVSQQLTQTEVKAKPGSRGLVMVKFIVDYTGEVSFARAVLADDPEIETEAIRIIKSSPKWEPGKIDGKDVSLVVTWPLRFAQ